VIPKNPASDAENQFSLSTRLIKNSRMEKHARLICCAGGGQNNKCSVFCSLCPKNVSQIWSVINNPSG
jgi:hypothetical protein